MPRYRVTVWETVVRGMRIRDRRREPEASKQFALDGDAREVLPDTGRGEGEVIRRVNLS